MKKVLVLGANPASTSPALRFRVVQFVPFLRDKGYEILFSSLFSVQDERYVYSPGHYAHKALVLLKATLRRVLSLFLAFKHPIVVVQRESYILGTTLFERCFKLLGCKLIYDFDDAVWLPNVSAANKALGRLKNPNKTAALIRMAHHVIAGNDYLAQYALRYNPKVSVLPTVVDTDLYKPASTPKQETDTVVIGWSGSRTTVAHFSLIIDALRIVKQRYGNKVSFVLMGDEQYRNEELGIQGLAWHPTHEVPTVQTFDIGIMPLPDDDWSKGKCAFKAILYMSMGVPAIVSPVGANVQVVQEGITGLHASTTAEWVAQLSRLIEDPALRREMGQRARAHIVAHYSVHAVQHKLYTIIHSLT